MGNWKQGSYSDWGTLFFSWKRVHSFGLAKICSTESGNLHRLPFKSTAQLSRPSGIYTTVHDDWKRPHGNLLWKLLQTIDFDGTAASGLPRVCLVQLPGLIASTPRNCVPHSTESHLCESSFILRESHPQLRTTCSVTVVSKSSLEALEGPRSPNPWSRSFWGKDVFVWPCLLPLLTDYLPWQSDCSAAIFSALQHPDPKTVRLQWLKCSFWTTCCCFRRYRYSWILLTNK